MSTKIAFVLTLALTALAGTAQAAPPPQPRIDTVSPATGPQTGGTAVTIKGDRFRGTRSVTIGGVALTGLSVIGDDTITGTTGASTTAGAVDVVVNGRHGSVTKTGGFTYTASNPATQISLVSGNNQTGPVGSTLPNPFVVVVKDAGGTPVAGFSVVFAITAGGGKLSATTVATNAQGQASTILTLGPVAGANTVTASANGLTGSPVTFTAMGTALVASQIAILSGNNQSGAAGAALASPFVVVVKDAGGTPVPGVTVAFAVTAGGGTLSATSVATNAQGQASSILTLGATPGTNTVTASSTGLTGSPLTFTAMGLAAPASSLAVVSGNNQTGVAGSALANPFVVITKDSAGNPVANVTITFAVKTGGGTLSATSVATNAQGQASTILTLGKTAGSNTVSASATGLTALTFTASGTAGPASVLVVTSGDKQTGTAGMALANPFVVTVRDANANPVSGVSVTFAVTAGGGTLSASTVASNAQGQSSTILTLGPTAGATNMVSASSTGLTSVTFTATALAAPTSSFATDVKPILEAKCTVCHTQGGQASFTPFTDTANGPASYAKVRNGTSFFQAGTPLVIAGDTTCILCKKTASNGNMFDYLGATTTEKTANSTKIFDWVKLGANP